MMYPQLKTNRQIHKLVIVTLYFHLTLTFSIDMFSTGHYKNKMTQIGAYPNIYYKKICV